MKGKLLGNDYVFYCSRILKKNKHLIKPDFRQDVIVFQSFSLASSN